MPRWWYQLPGQLALHVSSQSLSGRLVILQLGHSLENQYDTNTNILTGLTLTPEAAKLVAIMGVLKMSQSANDTVSMF